MNYTSFFCDPVTRPKAFTIDNVLYVSLSLEYHVKCYKYNHYFLYLFIDNVNLYLVFIGYVKEKYWYMCRLNNID